MPPRLHHKPEGGRKGHRPPFVAAERKRDALRARLEAAQAAPAAPEAPTVLIVEADSHAHRPPRWRRLLRRLRGS